MTDTDTRDGRCIQASEECAGRVELREALSGTGIPYERCDHHWAARLILESELRAKYPEQAPADFDPLYAGERWNEDDPWP
jgi:hypothetical protein